MIVNADLHEALYKNKTPVTTSQLPSSNIIDDGWYIQEMFSGSTRRNAYDRRSR